MKSQADELPPEFAAMIHSKWRKNEGDYWAIRDQLLEKYRDQWIGFADGAVVASGKSAVDVCHAAENAAEYPFCTCVGREHAPTRVPGMRWPIDEVGSKGKTRLPMKSLSELLPPEIVAQLHPDLLKNEAAYWAMRDELLAQYQDQWVGFADGVVVASGKSAVKVLHASQQPGTHPFVTCVGHEFEPDRIRRTAFPYDATVRPEPMPVIDVEFRKASGMPGLLLDRVIPDTGADASALPWVDCQRLQLDFSRGLFGALMGFGGAGKGTVVFKIWVQLDGREYECRLHADPSGQERILGRDVLNYLEILFRGPAGEVVVNP